MRLSTVKNQTPDSDHSFATPEREQYIWGQLAPRLIHPDKLAIIEAIAQLGEPLTVGDLAEVAGISEELARYHSKALLKEGVLELVEIISPREGGDGALLDFPPPPPESSPPSPVPAP